MRIVCFGDSLTQGTMGVSVVNRLAAALPGHEFINRGVNGDTSLNLYRRVSADVLALRPDAVLVMVGINDALSFTEPVGRWYYQLAKRVPGGKISPIAFRENLRAVLTRLTQAGCRVWAALPPVEYRRENVLILRQMNQHAAALCAELGIPALDLLARLTPDSLPERPPLGWWVYLANARQVLSPGRYDALSAAGGYSYSFDGIHLTERGAQRVADLIVPFLRATGLDGP